MGTLHCLTLKGALKGLESKKFSAQEIQQDVLASILAQNEQLNAYLDFHEEIPKNSGSGPLQGIPVAVKDNYLTTDLITTASSNVLRGYRPHYEGTVIKKLRESGAYLIGKTNLDAWAHGSSTETSDFGPSRNPRNQDYMPGGSSGGSAVAVAADMCIAAIGTETAGSVRQPAAWCGLVGLKPTYGRVSRYGIVAMASSLDSPGPMTKTVEDSALLLNVMAGHDSYDSTSSSLPVEDYTTYVGQPIKGMKIGVMYSDLAELNDVWPLYEPALKKLEELGAVVEPVVSMDPRFAIPMYAVLQRGEVSSNLARYDGYRYGHDRSHMGAEAKRRIMIGTYTLSKGYAQKVYVQAQKLRSLYIQDFNKLFKQFDVLVAPTSPGYALKLGESEKYPFFGELMDMLLEPSSMAGLPGINLPVYFHPTTHLPLGLNLISSMFSEGKIIQVASALEQALGINEWQKGQE
jgi:aspartyl-tRNA(Asn)/glutamyl-tRNA(Gln) amidotransferase subunit A